MTIIIALRKMRQSHESYFMCPRKLPPKLLSATLPFTAGGFLRESGSAAATDETMRLYL